MIILTVNAKNRPQTIKKAINHLIVGGIVAAKADTSYALLVLPRFVENHRILNKIKNARHNKQYSLFVAKKDDIVILTGKGSESSMCVESGKKIPWDEGKIVEEILNQQIMN